MNLSKRKITVNFLKGRTKNRKIILRARHLTLKELTLNSNWRNIVSTANKIRIDDVVEDKRIDRLI